MIIISIIIIENKNIIVVIHIQSYVLIPKFGRWYQCACLLFYLATIFQLFITPYLLLSFTLDRSPTYINNFYHNFKQRRTQRLKDNDVVEMIQKKMC